MSGSSYIYAKKKITGFNNKNKYILKLIERRKTKENVTLKTYKILLLIFSLKKKLMIVLFKCVHSTPFQNQEGVAP